MKDNAIVLTDSRGNELTHSVLAERLIQIESFHILIEGHENKGISDTLTYILEGGFKGFHNMTNQELISEWERNEVEWFSNYDKGYLPSPTFEDDPILMQPIGEQ